MGLDDADPERSLQRSGEGSQLRLQGRDRDPVGRLEYAEPLVPRTPAQIDARQRILCDNAKAANITIYTVQVNTGSDPTSAVLQYCAQNTSSFYLVTSAAQTATVFSQIGTQLSKLRVAR